VRCVPARTMLAVLLLLAACVPGGAAAGPALSVPRRHPDLATPPTTKPPGLVPTPPQGWMSWNHFRCGTDPASPDAISLALINATAAGLVSGGFAAAGYTTLAVDDCWQARALDAATGAVAADPARFPGGLPALGAAIRGFGLRFGLYGDVGPTTCGGFPGNGGHFGEDAAAMAAAGVDFFKADGCNAAPADLPALYASLSAALASSGRLITLSCSWPAYLPDARAVRAARHSAHPLPPIPYRALASNCHLWRNWRDVDTDPASIASIASYWAFAAAHSPGFEAAPRPGAWHDPDELLVGEPAVPYAWQAAQFALWCAWGAPLFLSADVRGGGGWPGWPPGSRALALHAELIAVNQRGAGPARLLRVVGRAGAGSHHHPHALQAWARPLEGGAVAVVAAKLSGRGARQACVSVGQIVRTAGRVWGAALAAGGEGSANATVAAPAAATALCWRPVSLAPRARPVTAYASWTDETFFPHRATGRLCLGVPDAGAAAVVVGRPCG